ncbi:hypothetical protein [Emticicia sp. 21SJ11W-3]|uniref:hypothetical protein n=1 Tax=Emticicia sp. 21SJ11W-3 TaxID=2916755 RepID=UPI0020A0B58D|nr:hypothetical protein [Emticicia sp. 21SJ11W-3]UTA66627.1 hypothetical protein MB380_13555 [Emticicia sp. 21SJ11W-3]
MLYRILYHLCWLVVSLVVAAIVAMAFYTFQAAGVSRSFWVVFGLLEALHVVLLWRGQFTSKTRALLLHNLNFGLLALVSCFVVYLYANVGSFRNDGDNSMEFRYFSYFFDNIFLVNLIVFIANFWVLCRWLLVRGVGIV